MQQSFLESIVSKVWKIAVFVPLFKGKRKGRSSNYRRIILSIVVGKMGYGTLTESVHQVAEELTGK